MYNIAVTVYTCYIPFWNPNIHGNNIKIGDHPPKCLTVKNHSYSPYLPTFHQHHMLHEDEAIHMDIIKMASPLLLISSMLPLKVEQCTVSSSKSNHCTFYIL